MSGCKLLTFPRNETPARAIAEEVLERIGGLAREHPRGLRAWDAHRLELNDAVTAGRALTGHPLARHAPRTTYSRRS